MKKDLIDRQEAIEKMAKAIWLYPNELCKTLCCYHNARDLAEYGLKDVPAVEPEIIYCKDCKHSFLHNNGEKTSRICGLTRMCGTTPDDWHCGDAERRTDE